MFELFQSPELVLLLLPPKNQCSCSKDMDLAFALLILPQSEFEIFHGLNFHLWKRTERIKALSEGRASPKPFGIWYCGAVEKMRKLDIFRNTIPKPVFHARLKKTTKNCVYSDRFILIPNMLNLDLTISFSLFPFPILSPSSNPRHFFFSSQILYSPMVLLAQHTSIVICWISEEQPAVLLIYSHHTHMLSRISHK